MNIPYKPQIQRMPDVLLSGEAIEQILAHLNNAILFAKGPDGTMRPFVDPIPITQIIAGAVQASVNHSKAEEN